MVYETKCKQVHKEQINYISRWLRISVGSGNKILSLGTFQPKSDKYVPLLLVPDYLTILFGILSPAPDSVGNLFTTFFSVKPLLSKLAICYLLGP